MQYSKLIFISTLMAISSQAHSGQYNFYFMENGKAQKQSKPSVVQTETLDKDRIADLADEVAEKIKKDLNPEATLKALTPQKQSDSMAAAVGTSMKSFFGKKSYFNFGTSFESYLPRNQLAYVARFKVLPLITLEATMTDRYFDTRGPDIYRASGLIEGEVNRFLSINANGGALINRTSYLAYNQENEWVAQPFAGVGAKLKLFRFLDLTVSANTLLDDQIISMKEDMLDLKKDKFFLTAGINLSIF